MRIRPAQRVILYRHGLANTSEKRKAISDAKSYREKSGREYFDCPGGCGVQVSLRDGKVYSHFISRKDRIRCTFKGELP